MTEKVVGPEVASETGTVGSPAIGVLGAGVVTLRVAVESSSESEQAVATPATRSAAADATKRGWRRCLTRASPYDPAPQRNGQRPRPRGSRANSTTGFRTYDSPLLTGY